MLVALLAAGSAYFLLVALTHSLGQHVPGPYIFFDVPSVQFQDQIIGLLAFGWAAWLAETARRCRRDESTSITFLLVAGLVAVLALVRILLITDLPVAGPSMGLYWLQVAVLAGYVVALFVASLRPRPRV